MMAQMPVLVRPPPPAYRERYPEGRDRLLALSEQQQKTPPTPAAPVSSPSSTGDSPPSSASPVGVNRPRMGLRAGGHPPSGDKKSPLRQSQENAPRPQPRPATMYASEQSLPDRLSQALRALRPAALSHSTSGSSPFKNKNAVIEADDVVYYASRDQQKPQPPRTAPPIDTTPTYTKEKTKSFAKCNAGSPTMNNNYLNHGMEQLPASSLEQLRALYKSAPDFGTLEEEQPGSGVVQQWHQNGGDQSPYAAQSPTDSGYRSAPRHLDSSSSALDESVPSVSSNPAHNSVPRVPSSPFPNQVQFSSSLQTGLSLIQATVVHVNGSPNLDVRKSYMPPPPSSSTATADSLDKSSLSARSFSSNESTSYTYIILNHNSGLTHRAGCRRRGIAGGLPPIAAAEAAQDKMVPTNGSLNGFHNGDIQKPSEQMPLLVKLESTPWTDRDVVAVLQRGRTKEFVHRIGVDVVPRLSTILERPLIRLCREIQRLSVQFAKCTQHDVKVATKIVLSGAVADSCLKAGIQATTIYALSGSEALRQSMSRRAGTRLSVGKFLRWMVDARVGLCISEQAAVFLTAVMESLLEELVLACLPWLEETTKQGAMLTADSFESAIAESAEVWGLLQPYEHLISSRNARGQLCLHISNATDAVAGGTDGTATRTAEQSLLATCVGGVDELIDLVGRVSRLDANSTRKNLAHCRVKLSSCALEALFYFMRCSQLEHQQRNGHAATQALTREKPYLVLPPLTDWLRVCGAFAEHRGSPEADAGDVVQAARVLLPSIDCPPRTASFDCTATQDGGHMKRDLAFRMLLSANSELVSPALNLLGPMRHRTLNTFGLTALAEAVVTGNEAAFAMLIATGADVNIGVPIEASVDRCPRLLNEFAGWTPLTWAVSQGNIALVHALIDACADVDNQSMLAAMIGEYDAAARLVVCGGDPFRSSINYDAHSADFRHVGAPSALALAAAHGHRALLHMMLSKGQRNRSDEPITLKDFLSESGLLNRRRPERSTDSSQNSVSSSSAPVLQLTKMQQRSLNEALYYAAETAHLDIAIDLRNLGIPWNTHTWLQCVKAAHEVKRRGAVVALLGDFSPRLADELDSDTIDEAVPLLFDILRHECWVLDGDPTPSAAIISRLYTRARSGVSGAATVDSVSDCFHPRASDASRPTIDPRFVNNSELSDVRFKVGTWGLFNNPLQVEDRVFYAHRIVLVNASEEFKRLLECPKGQIDIDNVAYDVFELMMDYLYRGGFSGDRLRLHSLGVQMQLVDAARTFGLGALVRDCRGAIRQQISLANCLQVYKFAARKGIESLQADCEIFMLEHLSALVDDAALRRALQHSPSRTSMVWTDLTGSLANRLAAVLDARARRV